MSIVKRRPKIRLKLPAELHPGEPFSAKVLLEVGGDEALQVDGVSLTIAGTETASIGAGKSRSTQRVRFPPLVDELSGPTLLEPGSHAFRATFKLPEDAPPTYHGADARTIYEARVHVDIPWWPDARARYEVFVTLDPRHEPPRGEPKLFASRVGGPQGREAHAEVSLSSTVLAPGDRLEGSLALANVAHNRYRGVRLRLVGTETRKLTGVFGERKSSHVVWKHDWFVPVEQPVEGAPVPFALVVPPLAPTYASRLWSVHWHLEVRLDVALAMDTRMEIPVTIRVPDRPETAPPRTIRPALPSVGSPRIAAVWDGVARELALRHESGTLRGGRGDVDLVVAREHRGRGGTIVRGRLVYPPLHLGLKVRPARATHWLFPPALTEGRYAFEGRDAGQATAVMRAIARAIERVPLTAMDDDDAVAELPDGGRSRDTLAAFTRDLVALADAIVDARAAIPPPAPLAPQLDSWRALAERLHGTLETARMIARGTFRDAEATIETIWLSGGVPGATRLALRSAALGHAEEFGAAAPMPGNLGDLAARAELREGELSIWIDPWLGDPLPLLETLGRLHDAAARLGRQAAPYR
jgi:hypothetical protein